MAHSSRWARSRHRRIGIVTVLAFICMTGLARADAAAAFTVSGTVTLQATGLGLAETQVTVDEVASGDQLATAVTALNGSYSINVPPGEYDISFSPPAGSGYGSFAALDETVNASRTLNAVLEPSGSGVTFTGTLLGEGGVPLPGDTVRVGNEDATTNSAGEFALAITPGTYSLRIYGQRAAGVSSAAAPEEFDFSGASIALTASVHENLTLPVHALTVRTLGAGAIPLKGVAISGASTNYYIGEPNGTLAPGIAATYGEVNEEETTGSAGTATLSLPDYPAAQTIDAVPPPETHLVRTPIAIGKVAADETREVQLGSGVTFTGTLLGEGGVPLPGDTVRVGNEDATTNSAGEFALAITPGTYSLRIYGQRAAGVSSAAAPEEFDFSGASIALTASVHENLTLPVHALTVRTLAPVQSRCEGRRHQRCLHQLLHR